MGMSLRNNNLERDSTGLSSLSATIGVDRPTATIPSTTLPEQGPTLEGLQQQLGYYFSNPELLYLALTHRSCLQDEPHGLVVEPPDHSKPEVVPSANAPFRTDTDSIDRTEHNERLEFLGDAVLELAISDILFRRYPQQPEGALSNRRSSLVNTQSLGRIGHDHHLGHFLKMGRGEALSGGRHKVSLLANTVEALLGAIYLDGGYKMAYKTIKHIFTADLDAFQPGKCEKDYKSMLQEQLQGKGRPLPEYQVITVSGAHHERVFQIACMVRQEQENQEPVLAMGVGRSKRTAEQSAAQQVLVLLEQRPPTPEPHTVLAPERLEPQPCTLPDTGQQSATVGDRYHSPTQQVGSGQ